YDGAVPFYMRSAEASAELQHVWYRDCFFRLEHERGLDDHEDHLFAAQFNALLEPGKSLTFVFSTNENASLDGATILAEQDAHEPMLLESLSESFPLNNADVSPPYLQQLGIAADQFVVKRTIPGIPEGRSIIAGYHWFGDWGRDTMIALPGLSLA